MEDHYNIRKGDAIMKQQRIRIVLRLGLLAIMAAAFVLGCRYLYLYGSPFACPFYELTGLCCPGCGSGRAATALVRGHFAEAFRYNPLLILLGIPFGFVAIWELLAYTLPCRMRRCIIPQWLAWTLLAVIVIFWILRNIPLFSFLAPY